MLKALALFFTFRCSASLKHDRTRKRFNPSAVTMELFWWFLTIVLFAVGLIGTIAPVLPGTTVILAAAVIHRLMLGPDKSIGWHAIIVLVLLTFATYGLDVLAGYFGAKYFGATRWGTFGAI